MSQSRFFSSLILLIGLNALIKPVWIFGIDRQVQNISGVTEYGTYFSLLNLSIVLGFLLDWGISNFVNQRLAAQEQNIQRHLGSLLLMKVIFFAVYLLAIYVIAYLAGVSRWHVLIGVVCIQFLTFLFLFLRTVVTANQWFVTDAWLSVLDKSLMIVVCGGMLLMPAVFGHINIDRFLAAQIACTSLATVVVLVIIMSRGIRFERPSLAFFDRRFFFAIAPFALTLFLMSIHIRLDGFLLERLHPNGSHEAGIYAAAYRLLDASNMVGYLVASFFMPFAARLWSEKKAIYETILQTRHLQLFIAVTISAIAITLGPQLVSLLYHRSDHESALVMQCCLPALIGYGLTQVYGTVLTATGQIGLFCRLNVVAVTVNILVNVIFIPKYGALACCIAAMASQLLLGILTMITVHRELHESVQAGSLFLYAACGLVVAGLIWLSRIASISLIPTLIIALTGSIVFMFITRLATVTAWLGFIKKQ